MPNPRKKEEMNTRLDGRSSNWGGKRANQTGRAVESLDGRPQKGVSFYMDISLLEAIANLPHTPTPKAIFHYLLRQLLANQEAIDTLPPLTKNGTPTSPIDPDRLMFPEQALIAPSVNHSQD